MLLQVWSLQIQHEYWKTMKTSLARAAATQEEAVLARRYRHLKRHPRFGHISKPNEMNGKIELRATTHAFTDKFTALDLSYYSRTSL